MNEMNPSDNQLYLFDMDTFLQPTHIEDIFSSEQKTPLLEKNVSSVSDKANETAVSEQNQSDKPAAILSGESSEALKARKTAELQLRKKQRYTKYCINWLYGVLGTHFTARMLGHHIPVIDLIDPLYAIKVERGCYGNPKEPQNFFSALVNCADCKDVLIFMNLPQIQQYLNGPDRDAFLNLKGCRDTLHEMLSEPPNKNPAFQMLFRTIAHYTGTFHLMQSLFPDKTDETHKESPAEKPGGQIALGLLISRGWYNEALAYLRELPDDTTFGQLCEMLNDKEAIDKLNRLSHTQLNPNTLAARFLSALEHALPLDIYQPLFRREPLSYSYLKDFDLEERKNTDKLPWLKDIPMIAQIYLKPDSTHKPDTFKWRVNAHTHD